MKRDRERILAAASKLIAQGGVEAATTRAVATAAKVQAPTLYRMFGDKRGLLAAVVEDAMRRYVAQKTAKKPNPDPLEDLRDGWDLHIEFGLSHPGLIAIMSSDPTPASRTSAAEGEGILRRRIQNLARAGRLRVPEQRAIDLVRSMGTGVVLTLLQQPEEQRDVQLSTAAREAVISAITGETALPRKTGIQGAATALQASLDQTDVLSKGERALLSELLDRIAH
ncbi:MAG: TetR/AcrR family transcriptional regulator [Archangium sp.]